MLLKVFFLSSLYTAASQSQVTSQFPTFWPCNMSQPPPVPVLTVLLDRYSPTQLSNCYFPDNSTQAVIGYTYCQLYMYHVLYKWVQLKPKLQHTETDKRQHDRPASCVIAQLYSWTSFVSLGSHLERHLSLRFKKTWLFNFFLYQKICKSENCETRHCVNLGLSLLHCLPFIINTVPC
jgi:hypothetical protein